MLDILRRKQRLRSVCALLAACVLLAACAAADQTPEAPEVSETPARLIVLAGPTGVGAAKLMADADAEYLASADVVADNDAAVSALLSGEADIAAVATNVAASLYNRSDGAVRVIAVNTLGVLYLLEKGDSLRALADLRGRTLYAAGQGANPEYVLDYLLRAGGVDPSELTIEWMTAQEITARMPDADDGTCCLLPVPAATALLLRDPEIREALSLSDLWDEAGAGRLAQGCLAARTDYLEQNPETVERFLAAYERSIAYMSDPENAEDAAALVAAFGITASAEIAAAALPRCGLTFLRGAEMKDALESYYGVLYAANPASIGGALPDAAFYYDAEPDGA